MNNVLIGKSVFYRKDDLNFVILSDTMLAVAKNYDILCYHLRVVHKNLDHPIRAKVDAFLKDVRADLLHSQLNFEKAIEEKLSEIFELRLIAIKSLLNDGESLLNLLKNEAYPYFERMAEVEELSGLSDNILFALRCNKKVIDALVSKFGQEDLLNGYDIDIPEISYEQFKASIYLSIPDNDSAKSMLNWVNCSLRIEYVICSTAMIYDEQLKLSSEKINQLSSTIINAAQTYAAIAIEAGFISNKGPASNNAAHSIEDSDFLDAQKRLAEAGIDSFAQNWKD